MIALTPRQGFLLALGATLAFRFWLAASLPLTGDEAYFLLWGRNPDIGFYDHPPMVGWLHALTLTWSDAEWALRLPSTLLPAALALLVRAWLMNDADQADGADKADLAATLMLLMPMHVWNVLVTTDTPLILFSLLSLLAFARGRFAWAGVLLGLAFTSKYFAVLLGLSYLVWAILARRPRDFTVVFLGALPFGLLNLYWNYKACWSNVMFNAINRHEDAGWSFSNPLLLLASLAYVAAPLAWYAWRERARMRTAPLALILAWAVPLAVFAVLSPVKRVGLHWLLSFFPALVLTCAHALERAQLASSARFFGAFALLHAVAATAVAALPLETWRSWSQYGRLVPFVKTREVLAGVEPYLDRYRLAADGYAAAATYSYYSGRGVFVFGQGSSHARHDDILTDVRALEGKDIVVLRRSPPPERDYRPYFRAMDVKSFAVSGVEFYAVLGQGFDYRAYRQGILEPVRERYYRIPRWLPVGRCYFCERYFGGAQCAR